MSWTIEITQSHDKHIVRFVLKVALVCCIALEQGAAQPTLALANTVFVSPAICDGVTDARAALQDVLTRNGGKAIVLPEGAVCLIEPAKDKTKFLTLEAGTVLRGNATLKVADGSAPYDSILYSKNCNRCKISEFVIDANIANNSITDVREIYAHARTELVLFGDDVTVQGITIMNSSPINSVVVTGARITVEGSIFKVIGDDPHHVVHDHSTLYLSGSQIVVRSNHFTAAARDSPAAVTAIETHGTIQSITGNTIADFTNGINFTGVYHADSEASVVSDNSISGVLYCITLWSHSYLTHQSGYGINGLAVSGNSCRVNQLSYIRASVVGSTTGIIVESGATLPVENLAIHNNVVVFDLEPSPRHGNSASIGIGWWSTGNQSAANVSIENNILDNAPVAGIRMAVGSAVGLKIRGNIIRNAGSSLDGDLSSGYKSAIFAVSTTGLLQADIEANTILDDLPASRMASPLTVGGAAGFTHEVRILDNSIHVLGAKTVSFKSDISLLDNNVKPVVWSAGAAGQQIQ